VSDNGPANLTVVPLREMPSLQDIPALLRRLADQIANGEVEAKTLYVVIPQPGKDYPKLRGWGDVDGDRQPIVQVALLQHWLLSRETARS
jgi:hypothetical protein